MRSLAGALGQVLGLADNGEEESARYAADSLGGPNSVFSESSQKHVGNF
jgi:hypothetical protein